MIRVFASGAHFTKINWGQHGVGEISLVHDVCLGFPIDLKFFTEHGNNNVVLCAKFHYDGIIETGVMDEPDFAKFEIKINFGRIDYISKPQTIDLSQHSTFSGGWHPTKRWRHVSNLMTSQVTGHSFLFLTVCLGSYHKKLALLRLCEWNPPVTGCNSHKGSSNVESVSISWHHRMEAY